MQVCSPTVSFMAQGTYAIESTTAFSAYLCWLPNFLLDQSLPLMTLQRLVIFCAVYALVVLRPVGLWQRGIYGRGLLNSFCVCKQGSAIAPAWTSLQVVCVHACVFECQCYCSLSLSKKLPQLFMKMPNRQHRLCWESDFLFFHTSFEK